MYVRFHHGHTASHHTHDEGGEGSLGVVLAGAREDRPPAGAAAHGGLRREDVQSVPGPLPDGGC